jgi:hypothetical protein
MSSLRQRTIVVEPGVRTNPASTRNALVLIIAANLTIVVTGGVTG